MEGWSKRGVLTSVKCGRGSRQPRLTLCDCAPWFLPPAGVDEGRHGQGEDLRSWQMRHRTGSPCVWANHNTITEIQVSKPHDFPLMSQGNTTCWTDTSNRSGGYHREVDFTFVWSSVRGLGGMMWDGYVLCNQTAWAQLLSQPRLNLWTWLISLSFDFLTRKSNNFILWCHNNMVLIGVRDWWYPSLQKCEY